MNDFKAQTASCGKMNEKLICLQILLWSMLSILHFIKINMLVLRVMYINDDYFVYFLNE